MRNTAEALAWARSQHRDKGTEWRGWCLVFVRSCYGVGAHYPSAAEAWRGAKFKHRVADGDRVPRGVPYFWTGGSRGFGHVVISVGGGLCWSNDIKVDGGISLVRIDEITRRWGQKPEGWTEDLNTVRVWQRPMPAVVDLSELARAYRRDPARPGDEGTKGSRRDVRRVERALVGRGYLDPQFVDGSYGTRTVEAMRRFQSDRGLDGGGQPTLESVKAVGRGTFKVRG